MADINGDQVAWFKDALWRYGQTVEFAINFPRCSQLKHAAEIACLMEIMKCLDLRFQDEAARNNAFSGLATKTSQENYNMALNQANTARGADNA